MGKKNTQSDEYCFFANSAVICKDSPCKCANRPNKEITTPFGLKLQEEASRFNAAPPPYCKKTRTQPPRVQPSQIPPSQVQPSRAQPFNDLSK